MQTQVCKTSEQINNFLVMNVKESCKSALTIKAMTVKPTAEMSIHTLRRETLYNILHT